MLASLRSKLFASYVLIAVFSVLIVSLASGVIVRGYQHDSQVRSLQAYAVLVRGQVQSNFNTLKKDGDLLTLYLNGGQGAVRDKIVSDLVDDADKINVRLLVVAQGQVLKDTQGALDGSAFPLSTRAKINQDRLNKTNFYADYQPSGTNTPYLYVSTDIAPVQVGPAARQRTAYFGTVVVMQAALNPWSGLFGPMLLASAIALLLSILGAFLLGRTISRPVLQLKEATAQIGRGNYQHQIVVRGSDELAALGHSFNQMAAAVQQGQQSQRDFLANISHDLKTPLTSIQGFSQAIMDGTLPDPRSQQGAARVINDEAQRMSRLVNTLLEISHLQTGHLELRKQQLDLAALLTASVEGLEPQANAKDVSLGSSGLRAIPPIIGDSDRLRQVFTNLVDNAIRHTPAGGWVEVEAESAGLAGQPAVLVKVSDSGEGIPAQDLPRIFERFYQVEKSRARGEDGRGRGLGLGLSIVKEVIVAHGGQIAVSSEVGGGTTFTVTLPAVMLPSLPAPLAIEGQRLAGRAAKSSKRV